MEPMKARPASVACGGANLGKAAEKLSFIHLAQMLLAENAADSAELLRYRRIVIREIGMIRAAVNDAQGMTAG